MSESGRAHRADIDLLRVFAVLLLFPFHAAKVYDPQPWYHVWSPDLLPGLDRFTGFVHLWHMPLLFLLAGWSAVASLRSRRIGAFLRERRSRLLVPLLVGVVFLCPILKYVELRSGISIGLEGLGAAAWLQQAHGALQAQPLPVAPPFDESFLEFLPTFFTPARVTWSHLWFVAYLLVFSVAYAPLLGDSRAAVSWCRCRRSRSGRRRSCWPFPRSCCGRSGQESRR